MAEKIVAVRVTMDTDTVMVTWAVTRTPTSGPHAGRPLKVDSTVYIPRTVFATAVEAWRTQEGA